EVETLRELRLFDQDSPFLADANSQASRLPRIVPVWYACQGVVLRYLPVTERNARLLPALCAVLAVLAAYVWAARRYGLAFGACLALLMAGSPALLEQAQQNRFYSMAILFLVLATAALFARGERAGPGALLLAVAFAALAVLCHSLVLVYFVL